MSSIETRAEHLTGTWTIDPSHSSVEFSVKHMMITTVKGRFGSVEGTVTADGESGDGWLAEVNIDAASIDTGASDRDDHLRSADFLNVESHPRLTFRSKRVEGAFAEPGDEFEVIGDLTIRGTTREAVLATRFEGAVRDPWGGDRLSFSATTKIDRREFGLQWNQALEAGGVLVGNEVRIDLDVQLVKQG
ncbi:MAG TPA: YceI family protein [Longimicrobiaceae bacterium]|nr:YceI family protein [Longimicrobiaceae bacterium]